MVSALRMTVVGLVAVLMGAAGPAGSGERGVPQRIMSLNVCTDLLLLELAPRSRIASVTFLAPEGARALFPGAVAGIPLNHGAAEDIVNVRPDLILDSGLSNPMTKRIARLMGVPVVEVKNADSFPEIRDVVRQVGAAVGEPARAEALIDRMDATLADLAAHPPSRRLRVVAWSGGSAVPGPPSGWRSCWPPHPTPCCMGARASAGPRCSATRGSIARSDSSMRAAGSPTTT